MADWQDLFNQIGNVNTYNPKGLPSGYNGASMPVTQGMFGTPPPPAPKAPTAGGLGDTLASFGKGLWQGTMNDLDYLFTKPLQTAATAVLDPITDLKNYLTGNTAQNPDVYKDIQNIWSQPGSNVVSQRGNNLFGYNPAGKSDLANAFSPGSLIDDAVQVFGGGKYNDLINAGANAITDLAKGAGSVYRQAAAKAVAPVAEAAPAVHPALPAPVPSSLPSILDSQLGNIGNAEKQATAKFSPTSPVPFVHTPEILPPLNTHVPEVPQIAPITDIKGTPVTDPLQLAGHVPQDLPRLQPTGMNPFMHDLEILNPGSSKLKPQIPITQDGEFQNILDSLGHGTSPVASELQKMIGSGAAPEMEAATASTVHPNPTTVIPDVMPEASQVYKNVPFDSPLLQQAQALNQIQKPQMLQRLQDALARWGIMGSGLETQAMKNSGASDIIKNALADKNNGQDTIEKYIEELARQTGQSGLDDIWKAVHDYEAGNGVADNETFQKLLHALQHGAPDTKSGLVAEQAAGVAPNDLRDNYFPIRMNMKDMTQEQRNMMDAAATNPSMNLNRRNFDQRYTLDRSLPSNWAAQDAGYNVHDPFTSVAQRLLESNHDVNMASMYNKLLEDGLQKGYVSTRPGADMVRYASKDAATNALNGKYIHKDLAQTLNTMFDRTPFARANIPVISPVLSAWDKMSSFARNMTLYTPMTHLHNVFGNALMAAGISPAKYLEAEQTLKGMGSYEDALRQGSTAEDAIKAANGNVSPEMKKAYEWATKTGALGENYGQDIATKVQRALGNKGSILDQAKEGYQKFQNKALWNREKALRLGVYSQFFKDAMAQGLPEETAANVARDATLRHMIDYSSNNLSTFEKEFMSRVDPFYRWHKGNYALQASKLVSDPRYMNRVAQTQAIMNNMQQNMTGHDMNGNMDGNNGKLQSPMDNQGNFEELDPYLPFQETGKLLSQNPANTMFNRISPWLREAANQATNNQYYPSQAVTPVGKDYMTGSGYEIHNPATSAGQQIIDTLKHAATHTVLPTDQAIPAAIAAAYQGATGGGQQGKYPSVPPLDQLLADLTGGFMSSSPVSQSKTNAQNAKELKWIKAYQKAAQKQKGN